ncbi:MAG: ABC transporter permease [Gemmatimonadaceae bacterium]|nr:ABC transporter permease [Gemmatimonadaceae bacterium]
MADTPAVAAFAIAPPRTLGAETVGTARDYWRAITDDTAGRAALGFLALLGILAIAAPWIATYDPTTPIGLETLKLKPPSWSHPLGTDAISRDVLSRMLHGARISLRIALLAAGLSGIVGLVWGAAAGYLGGTVDAVLMRLVDMMLAVPRVLLVLTLIPLWPDMSTDGLILVLGLTGWFGVSRLARAQALGVRHRDFVHAARALGASRLVVLVRHVMPHAIGPVLVATTVGIGHVLVLEAGLTYLGLGVRPPTPSWGSIVAESWETLQIAWWLVASSGAALIGTSLAVNAIADRLRVAIHPRQLPGR